MKFIDINCMIGEWSYKILHFKTVEELNYEMSRLEIVKSFVFHSRSWLYDPREGNDAIIAETRLQQNLVPVLTLTPLIDEEFGGKQNIYDIITKNGVGAVRLFPFDQNFTLNPWNVDKLFSILDEINMPVFIECLGALGGTIDQHYNALYELSKTYRNTPIVLLNPGYRSFRIFYSLLSKCPNLYMDTSTLIPFRGIEDVVKNFGSERILFGTRMPFMESGVSVGRLLYAEIDQKDKENIAFRNALRLLKNNKLYSVETKGGISYEE